MIVLGKTEEEIKAILDHECRERIATLWGEECTIKPYLVKKIHGDGMQLVWWMSLDTRPNYYVLRIDSGIEWLANETIMDKDDPDSDYFTDYAYVTISEECDCLDDYEEDENGMYYDEQDDPDGEEPFDWQWPMLKYSTGGCTYGSLSDI